MSVGILGAGAIGLPLGYMLSTREKNKITYFVRDAKVEAFPKKTSFYSYDKKKIFVFDSYSVKSTNIILNAGEGGGSPYDNSGDFDLVVIALPSDVLFSQSGKDLIKGLSLITPPETSFLVLSPGYQMMERVFDPVGIEKSRVSFGLPLFLSHEVSKSEQLVNEKHPLMREADLAFHYLMNSRRILLISRKPKTLRKTLKLGKKKSIGLGTNMLDASTAMFVVMNLLLWLQDYPKKLKRDKTFTAGMKALYQMTRQHGGSGRMVRSFTGKSMLQFVDRMNRRQSRPLTTEFLRYHHGHKVLTQNIQLCKEYIEVGSGKNKKIDKIDVFVTMCTAKQSQQDMAVSDE